MYLFEFIALTPICVCARQFLNISPRKHISIYYVLEFMLLCGGASLTPRASTRATVQHQQQFAQVARQSFTGDAVQRVPLSSICNPDDFSTVPTVAGVHSEMVIFSSLKMITSRCHGHVSNVSSHVQKDQCKWFRSLWHGEISSPILFLSFSFVLFIEGSQKEVCLIHQNQYLLYQFSKNRRNYLLQHSVIIRTTAHRVNLLKRRGVTIKTSISPRLFQSILLKRSQ